MEIACSHHDGLASARDGDAARYIILRPAPLACPFERASGVVLAHERAAVSGVRGIGDIRRADHVDAAIVVQGHVVGFIDVDGAEPPGPKGGPAGAVLP